MFLLFGSTTTASALHAVDRFEDLRGRRVHRLPAGDDAAARRGSCSRRRTPSPTPTATTAVGDGSRRARSSASTRRPRAPTAPLRLDLLEQVGDADVARAGPPRCRPRSRRRCRWCARGSSRGRRRRRRRSSRRSRPTRRLNPPIVGRRRVEEVHHLVAQTRRRRRPRGARSTAAGVVDDSGSGIGRPSATSSNASSSSVKPAAARVDDARLARAPAADRACARTASRAAIDGPLEHLDERRPSPSRRLDRLGRRRARR